MMGRCRENIALRLSRVAPTGRRVSVTGIDVVRVADGKIVEHRGLTDIVGLMRQLTDQAQDER